MTEQLSTLAMLSSTLCFARFARTERTGDGVAFGAVAISALSRSSGITGAAMPPRQDDLAGGDWFWRNTEDRFDTPEKLAALLDELSVTIIVIDDQVAPDQQRPYHERLKKLVAGRADRWELVGSYPQTRGGIVAAKSLHVSALRPVASLTIAAPMIPLEGLKALMVRKELR